MTTYPRILPVGETAFTVEFGNVVDEALNRQVHAFDAAVQAMGLLGLIETVPTYRSLLVIFDPAQTTAIAVRQALHRQLASFVCREEYGDRGRLIEIPVRYGGAWGPDLEAVAEHCGLSAEAVIHHHTAPVYRVAMLGFAPGFAYLLGLPPELATPRLATPRVRVPAGSVGIADAQTGIYALSTPGGWRIIGRTEMHLFDPDRDPPFLVTAGDRVRFVAVM